MRIVIIAVVALLGAAGAFLWWQGPQVDAVSVVRGDVAEVVYATGAVEPVVWAKVSPLLRGRITEHCRCEGQNVRKGEELAHLDDSAAQAELRQAIARRDFLLSELNRQIELMQRNITSRAALERTESDYQQASALIGALNARLVDYSLRAPIDGTVMRADGQVGDIATPGEVLFWVGRSGPLQVVAEVNEEDVPRLAEGQKVLLRNDGFPAGGIAATLGRITPKGDPVAKTFRVYMALPEDTPLRVGMSVEANIVVRTKTDALIVPADAFANQGVYVVADGKLRHQPVSIGIRGTRTWEILSGLEPGTPIVQPLPAGHRDGLRVRLRGA